MHFWFMSENKKEENYPIFENERKKEGKLSDIAIEKNSWGNLDDKKKRKTKALKVKWYAQQEIAF